VLLDGNHDDESSLVQIGARKKERRGVYIGNVGSSRAVAGGDFSC
jgi:hypothetical protein